MTRKQELTALGKRLFVERGYENTRVDDILEASGMSKGGFYHHFKSKEDVLRALVADEVAALADGLQTPEAVDDPAEALVNLFLTGSSQLTGEPGIVATLTSLQAQTLYLDALEGQFDHHFKPVLTELIAQGVASGAFEPVDPAGTAEVFVAVNNHGNRQALLGRRTDGELLAFHRTALALLERHLGLEGRFAAVLDLLTPPADP